MSPGWIPGAVTKPALVIDYAWWQPDFAAVKAAGYTGIIRYFSHDLSKSLTLAELQRAHDASLGVGAIFEDAARRGLGGADAGRADGIYANAYADSIGWPKWKPIGYAIDFQPTADEIPIVVAYVKAAGEQGRTAYGYGDSDVIDALVAAGIPDDWQTCAWSHGVVNNKAALYQRLRPTTGLEGSFDEDVVLHPSNDLWYPGDVAPVAPDPTPTPTPPQTGVVARSMGAYIIRVTDGPSKDAEFYDYGFGPVHIDGPESLELTATPNPIPVKPMSGALFAKRFPGLA